ncbi:hypothetical protein Y032_0089g2304 [Ancylostoma ceylanicum]|uniref:Poly [ADP-ribose] polymerase n=1 Tax=Ancylostoma ceylanicum TaxID=53326 RepID=A0A016TMN1_9BILA|nr:hypothetical protein Y032_0089g2304 [Ancylostoma ceylanicum]
MARTKATLMKSGQAKKRSKVEEPTPPAPTRHSTRVRKPTVLHVAPDFVKKSTTKKGGKGARRKGKVEVVIEKKGKSGKTKVVKGRRGQDIKLVKKRAPPTPKKGNERLTPRPGVKQFKENPFFTSPKAPEYASFISNVRLLMRAITRGDLKEMRRIMRSDNRNIDPASCKFKFSHADGRSPDSVAILCKNDAVRQEYFKLRSQLAADKSPRKEPNLLQRRTTGRSNFYMLGRATRAVEMTRGGREGNNAFLKFESGTDSGSGGVELLIENGLSYKEIVKLSKETNITPTININYMDDKVVVAARLGLREMALAFAEGPAKSNMNDLHRETLKAGGTLPERILPVSVLKKGYNNANITPLHTAAINPNVKILERLRTIEPNINIPDTNNWYTIHYAAVCEGPEPLKFLLKNGAAPSCLTKQHETPLHVAARAGRKENIKILLEALAKLETTDGDAPTIKPEKSMINARTRGGDTALCLAVNNQRLDAVNALLAHKTVLVDHPTSTTHNKMTPLMLACSLGNLPIAECLIAHGAIIMARDHKKRTALSHAAINGQEHCAAMLLAKGADFLKGDSSGNTPAHYASAYGWLECLKLLASVDPSCLKQENDWKLTPLSISYLKGHYGIVRWLLEEKSEFVDINGKDMEGVTLLSSLLRYADEDCHSELAEQINYLLSRGADCSIADGLGNAIMHVFAGISIRIRQPGDSSQTGMTEKDYRTCFEEIMQHGGDVEAKNQSGETPLHIALQSANLLLFKWMLEYVRDIRKTLASQWSPDFNLLHVLMELPMKVWSNAGFWRGQSAPPQQLFDVSPIINDILLKHCNGEVGTWLRQPDSEGLQPVLRAARSYSTTRWPPNCQASQVKMFCDYINNLLMWACQLCPDCLTMASVPKKTSNGFSEPQHSTTLVYLALNVGLESGSLQLLKQTIQMAIEKKKLRELLELRGPAGYGLEISALRSNPEAARLILRTTKEHGCTEGVHNAVLVHEPGPEHEERKLLNKSLAMLIVEMKRFELINELQLSQKDWAHSDANGDNLWHYAARTQDLRAIELFRFIESKGVPIKPNKQDSTPLHEAVQTCDCSANSVLEPIEWLAANCPQVTRDTFGRTPLHYAFASRSQLIESSLADGLRDPIAVVSILSRNMNKQQLDWADCSGNTVLHLAAFKNANICAVTLLRKGVSVNVKNKDGNSPLAVAVLHGRQAVALTLIQADSNVTDQVFPPKTAQLDIDLWKWKGAKVEKSEAKVSTIPAQIIAKGGGWEAMVYVLMDALGTNLTSLVQMIDASLKECQYNLANQLTKSLQARLLGKKLPKSDYNLVLTFAEHFRGELAEDGVEHAVLHRLYAAGGEVMNDGVSLPLEAAVRHGKWALYKHFKARAGKAWTSLRPSQPTLGPLRNAVLYLSEVKDTSAETVVQELASLPHFSIDEPLSLPLPYELAETSLASLPAIAWACTLEDPRLVYHLRAAGADVNATDLEGRTPLMIALLANRAAAVHVSYLQTTKYTSTIEACQHEVDHRKTVISLKYVSVQTECHNACSGLLLVRRAPTTDFDNSFAFDLSLSLSLSLFAGTMWRWVTAARRTCREENSQEQVYAADAGHFSEDGSEHDAESAGSASEAEEQEAEEEEQERRTPPPKKIKICNKKLDLMLADRKGRNIIHYMVEPIQWENVELLQQLLKEAPAKIKQLLQQKNKEGNTPLDIAVKTKQRNIAAAMKAILGTPAKKAKITNDEGVSDLPDVSDLACKYKVDEDSEMYIELSRVEDEMDSEPETPKPSSMSGYSETADLVRCPITQQFMAAVLNKTDLNYGRYGFHNFYRIELMKRRDTDLWILFTNWGRIGQGVGEYQTTPFNSVDAALKEFKSIWRSKTGQDWGPLDKFQSLPKKYRLVQTTKRLSNMSDIHLPYKETKEEDLVRRTIQDISNPEKLKDFANQINWNVSCPFGHITEAAIERARDVLDRCEQNVQDLEKTLQKEGHTDMDVLKIFEKSRELSGEFYENFPVGDFEYGAVTIFDNIDEINRARDTLNRLTEVEVATRLLTASAQRPDVDRISYITAALECRFTEMSPLDDMSQKILRYIHSTGGSNVKIKGILGLTPRKATLNFEKFADDENQKFLWHGTKAVNLLSILKDGFLVDPRNTSITGRLFGDGVYLSDAFEKSSHYCQTSAKNYRYMILCRTALGKNYQLKSWNYSYGDDMPKGYDSLHVFGQQYPKTSITINGVAMPLCDFGDHSQNRYAPLQFSEYIVKDSTRVLPQYLVIFQ